MSKASPSTAKRSTPPSTSFTLYKTSCTASNRQRA